MGEIVSGIVSKIASKRTAQGSTMYNICADVGQGDEWFGYGLKKPDFTEGAEIEFEIEMKGQYANVARDSVVVLVEGPAPRRQAPARSQQGSRDSGRAGASRGASRQSPEARSPRGREAPASERKPAKQEVDWERKDVLIRLQSCQNTAIAFVDMLLKNEAVKLPAKAADKYDAALALVEKEAKRLFDKYTAIADGTYDEEPPEEEEYNQGGYADEEDIPE